MDLSIPSDAVGYLYRVDCSCGGIYVGLSEKLDAKSIERYLGSGVRWRLHLRSHFDHSQSKAVISFHTDP